jgi:hypothetical protein
MGIYVFCILFVFLQNSVHCGGGGQVTNLIQNLKNEIINQANLFSSMAYTKLYQVLYRGEQTAFFKMVI